MVLTKSELIASLQKEVRVLLHLASKIDRAAIDYRPTPKQRSTIEFRFDDMQHSRRRQGRPAAPLGNLT